MKSKIQILFLTILFSMSFSAVSLSEHDRTSKCNYRGEVVKILQNEDWQQKEFFIGVVNPSLALELFVNKKTQEWTIISTQDTGISCLVAYGKGIRFFDKVDEEE